MHKVFISYHHENDQWYKDQLIQLGKHYSVFIDKSVRMPSRDAFHNRANCRYDLSQPMRRANS